MSGASGFVPQGPLGRAMHRFEETGIAVILGSMTLIAFVNVVLRKAFNSGLLWGLEVVSILFAWLVLFGMSYAVKVTAHLGVDALINVLPKERKKPFALVAVTCCLAYALLLMKGAWDYFANFANLPTTTGRIIPTGFEDMRPQDFKGYKETDVVPFPEWARGPLENWLLLEGDPSFENLPVVFGYLIVPVGAALLLYRLIQATGQILRDERDSLIVSHEAEEAVAEARAELENK